MTKSKISITVDDSVLTKIDNDRGLASRSAVVNQMLTKRIEEESRSPSAKVETGNDHVEGEQ